MCSKLRIVQAVFGIVAVLSLAGTAGATVPKKWYWPTTKAEAVVITKLRIPSCRVDPDPTNCSPNGTPLPGRHPIGYQIGAADCTGSDELGTRFVYNRFQCRVAAKYARVQAMFAIYVTGQNTFRWRVLSAG